MRSHVHPDRLLFLMEQTGATPVGLALKAGHNRNYVRNILEGRSRNQRVDHLQKLADALEIPLADLLAPPMAPVRKIAPKTALSESARAFTENGGVQMRTDFDKLVPMSSTRDIPVIATQKTEIDGIFTLNVTLPPVDFVRRPARLNGVMGIFSIRVTDSSMVPWHKPDSIVFAHEHREAADGCHVIVELAGSPPGIPPRAFIKHLLRLTDTEIELEQYNPPIVTKLPIEQVSRVLRVLEWEDIIQT